MSQGADAITLFAFKTFPPLLDGCTLATTTQAPKQRGTLSFDPQDPAPPPLILPLFIEGALASLGVRKGDRFALFFTANRLEVRHTTHSPRGK